MQRGNEIKNGEFKVHRKTPLFYKNIVQSSIQYYSRSWGKIKPYRPLDSMATDDDITVMMAALSVDTRADSRCPAAVAVLRDCLLRQCRQSPAPESDRNFLWWSDDGQ